MLRGKLIRAREKIVEIMVAYIPASAVILMSECAHRKFLLLLSGAQSTDRNLLLAPCGKSDFSYPAPGLPPMPLSRAQAHRGACSPRIAAMTEAEIDVALQAAARAGDEQAKAFLRMWYSKRATRSSEGSGDPTPPPVAPGP